MDDEAIIDELVAIRGIGRWTAEMFLIFHLMRPNVLPLDDVGLMKGISLNYFSGEPVSRAKHARWARPGPLTARWRFGTFGAASTRCQWIIEMSFQTTCNRPRAGLLLPADIPRGGSADVPSRRGARNE